MLANREMCYDGQEKRLPNIDKDENSEMLFTYCIIHRGILVSQLFSLVPKCNCKMYQCCQI